MSGPKVIGMMGGGQLGRMAVLGGMPLGFNFRVFCPEAATAHLGVRDGDGPLRGYGDEAALEAFARSVDVVTLEFENIPVQALEVVQRWCPVHPSPKVLGICQNRRREKEFLRSAGIPCAPFVVVDGEAALSRAVAEIGLPCVLKTADFGYDGKGQIKITSWQEGDAAAVWAKLGGGLGVLEKWIPFRLECSAICARNERGETAVFPVAENEHRRHILHLSVVPARVSESVREEAVRLAVRVAEALDVVGLIAVEMFLTQEGELLVNELAPRPHNSGHYSIDACVTSQFEQHVRMVCGWSPGATELLRPVAMVNLLGDLWDSGEPDWQILWSEPDVKLHLYDKGEARPGRKMGHFCVFGATAEEAAARAADLFERLAAGARS